MKHPLTEDELDALPVGSIVAHIQATPKGDTPRYYKRKQSPFSWDTNNEMVWVDCDEDKSWGGCWRSSADVIEQGLKVYDVIADAEARDD